MYITCLHPLKKSSEALPPFFTALSLARCVQIDTTMDPAYAANIELLPDVKLFSCVRELGEPDPEVHLDDAATTGVNE